MAVEAPLPPKSIGVIYMNFLDALKEQIIVLDGATGTAIQDL